MTVVNPKSISGINSITMASGSDNLLTIHTTNTTERVRVNSDGDVIVGSGITVSPDGDIFATGVTTSTTFSGNFSGGTVSGTTGTFTGDVDIADKIIHTGDTNTALRFPSADTITAETGGSERLRIDSSGFVGIGTDVPNSYDSGGRTLVLDQRGTLAGMTIRASQQGGIYFADGLSGSDAYRGRIEYKHATDSLDFGTSGTASMVRITSAGKFLIGSTAARSESNGFAAPLQVEGTNTATSSVIIARNSANASSSNLIFQKSRGTSTGSNTVIQSGDAVGTIIFEGSDGTNTDSLASIIGACDGTPGTNDVPGRLVFSTTADGAATPTERLRIDSSGNLGINNASPTHKLDVDNGTAKVNRGNSSGEILILRGLNADKFRFDTDGLKFGTDTAAANALDDYEEGTWTPTNTIGLTLTNNNPAYYIKIGKLVMIQFDVSFSGASDTAQCGVIQSLPFTSENTTNHFSQGPLPHISTNSNFDLDPNLDDLLLFIGPDESRIDIFSFSINAQAARSSLVGRRIRHQMIYKAA